MFVKAKIVQVLKSFRKQKLFDFYLAQGHGDTLESYMAIYTSKSVAFVVYTKESKKKYSSE